MHFATGVGNGSAKLRSVETGKSKTASVSSKRAVKSARREQRQSIRNLLAMFLQKPKPETEENSVEREIRKSCEKHEVQETSA